MGRIKGKLFEEVEHGLLQDIDYGPEYEYYYSDEEIEHLENKCSKLKKQVKTYKSILSKFGTFIDED